MDALRARSLIVPLLAAPGALALPNAGAGAAVELRVVAMTGQGAPGAAAGASFALLGPDDFDGAPSIGADSSLAFAAVLSDGTAGFWIDHGSGPRLLALSGTPAPGTGPGVVFRQRISEAIIFTPPLLTGGPAAFRDTISGPGVDFTNDDCLWSAGPSGPTLTARADQPAPGIAGARLGALSLFAQDTGGRAVFATSLRGVLTGFNDQSIWRASPGGQLELLAREGDGAPGAGIGVVFAAPDGPSAFPIVIGNGAGDVLFQGNLHGPGADSTNNEALFIRTGTVTRLFIREGGAVPGMSGFVFREGFNAGFQSSNISLNDNGKVAIATRVASSMQTGGALLSDAGGALAPLVRGGDSAPGTSGRFDLLVSPVMNTRGDVAFIGSTTPGVSFPPLGLWIAGAGGVRAVALPGGLVAGEPDGALFQSVQSLDGLTDEGFVLFTAAVGAPGGFSGVALCMADPAGSVSVVARAGGTIRLGAGDVRVVSQVIVRGGALSPDAHAAFAVRFTDGTGAELLGARGGACGSADFDCDGDVGTDADIGAFFACLAGSCPAAPCGSGADFNRDGDIGTDADIEAFFRVLGGGSC
jgi:hypothetical protein